MYLLLRGCFTCMSTNVLYSTCMCIHRFCAAHILMKMSVVRGSHSSGTAVCYEISIEIPAETLDELTEVVTKMFSAVVNKGVPLPICVESPFTEKELQVGVPTYIRGTYSETSLIQHLYNPTFSLIQPSYGV